MVLIILGVLALFFVQTLLAPAIQYLAGPGEISSRVRLALGPRDEPPPRPRAAQRADRALRNLFEALPVFLTLALLSLELGVAEGLATQGAAVFFVSRLAYVPAYLSGVTGLRSLVWAIGHAGLITMVAAVVNALG